jgi:hypothetical protein
MEKTGVKPHTEVRFFVDFKGGNMNKRYAVSKFLAKNLNWAENDPI